MWSKKATPKSLAEKAYLVSPKKKSPARYETENTARGVI